MTDAIRLYFKYITLSARGQMQYRGSFVMQSIGQLFVTAIEFAAVVALFDRFGSLEGWRLAEVAFLYGMANISFSLADTLNRGFDLFGDMVRTGGFDRLLVRPRSTVLQLAGQDITMKRVGRLIQAVAVFTWAAVALDITWSPAKVALLAAAIISGVCLFVGLFIIQATVCFWTVESIEIVNVTTYGGVTAAQYPLSIYRSWFRKFFTFVVPLAAMNYFPAIAILGRQDPLGMPAVVHWAAPAAGFAFLAVSLGVWRFGVRHYCSTGS